MNTSNVLKYIRLNKFNIGNISSLYVSVKSKKNSKQEIFGREMAECFQKEQALPTLVNKDAKDGTVISELKTLISEMATLDSNNRRKINDVEIKLKFLEGIV